MNDERPIEKLLRRYAKKRRDDAGAPLDLHPATRRLLQGEVSRQFPKSAAGGEATSFTHIVKSWLPWLAWAVPVVVVVSLGVWAFVGRQEAQFAALGPAKDQPASVELAKNEEGPVTLAKKDMAETATPAGARNQPITPPTELPASAPVAPEVNQPSLTLADSGTVRREVKPSDQRARNLDSDVEQKATRARGTFEEDPSAARDQAGTRLSTAKPATVEPRAGVAGEKDSADRLGLATTGRTVRTDDLARTPSDGIADGKAPGVSASAAPVFERAEQSASLARRAGLDFEKAQNLSQTYANVASNSRLAYAAKVEKASPVLANFRVEQAGNQLRVIDSDGSTYLGEIEDVPAKLSSLAVETKGAADLKQKKNDRFVAREVTAPTAQLPSQEAQKYSYRVEGTNRTLNQQVVFTWSFVEPTNPPAESQTKALGSAFGTDKAKELQQFPVLLQNSGISGRARLDAGKEIEINAVPVK